MTTQLAMSFNAVHLHENNSASQSTLELKREDFKKQCWEILKLLMNGERLTTRGAIISGLSGHLPRRIADLKEFKINIETEWISKDDSTKTRSHVEYYMTPDEILRTQKRIINELEVK